MRTGIRSTWDTVNEVSDKLIETLMLFKDMFYKDYNVDEVKKLPEAIKKEISQSSGYHETANKVKVDMLAWVGIAVKK